MRFERTTTRLRNGCLPEEDSGTELRGQDSNLQLDFSHRLTAGCLAIQRTAQ